MSDDKNDPQDTQPDTAAEAETAAANENAPEASAAEETPADAAAQAPGAATEAPDPQTEIAELKDKLLRAVAETENMRRRADRERQDAAKYAVSNFARDVLAVADNLRRALDSVPEDQTDNEVIKTLVAGVELTENELKNAMERHGIRMVNPEGEKFDHNLHQAMFEVPNSGQPDGTVVQVMQVGYTIHDRLLRPAMVGVAKGGNKSGGGNDGNDTGGGPGEQVDTVA